MIEKLVDFGPLILGHQGRIDKNEIICNSLENKR